MQSQGLSKFYAQYKSSQQALEDLTLVNHTFYWINKDKNIRLLRNRQGKWQIVLLLQAKQWEKYDLSECLFATRQEATEYLQKFFAQVKNPPSMLFNRKRFFQYRVGNTTITLFKRKDEKLWSVHDESTCSQSPARFQTRQKAIQSLFASETF